MTPMEGDRFLLDWAEMTAWLKRAAEERVGRPEPTPDSREELLAWLHGLGAAALCETDRDQPKT